MILFPAIDLKDGRCVRLERGDMATATMFNVDPAAQARAFAAAGFAWLHVVDLDGAFAGRPVNAAAVNAILAAAELPVQLGGGVRDEATLARWLAAGVERVVLGTLALRRPEMVRAACRRHPGRIVVGIDARAGRVAVEGWAETSEVPARELALRFEDAGAAAIVYTDIERDGVLAGPNLEATAALAEALTTPVIASGGISSLADLRALKALEGVGVTGVICGRALYDGRIEPRAALALLAA
ncbi:MAG: 1-(5-phosphoribosyl)-5-[(5-phosphoribosylamino)methylideneamino]imidazole-4-carboxamide isomerase [Proteobacteria bacterium]|nr:1-(5-phosphoribosyl)-5-[(5-phosphoribosylamino)methylideneamino]imidazole-4-carboxamide isomerase [Pseudomonadota bacterium]